VIAYQMMPKNQKYPALEAGIKCDMCTQQRCLTYVRLLGARIGGELAFISAKTTLVICKDLRLGGDMFWMGIQEPGEAILHLTGASVKNLRDERESWPPPGHLILDGLAYEELTLHKRQSAEEVMSHAYGPELPFNVDKRIEWLMLQPPDRRTEPQPWIQLSKLLEAKGDRKGAKRVVFKYRALLAEEKEGAFKFQVQQG
jgi:hypothetical protein